jgi:hypothetical protein
MPKVVGSAEMQKDELEVLQFELRFLEGPSERLEQAIRAPTARTRFAASLGLTRS